MFPNGEYDEPVRPAAWRFATTRWSLVAAARQRPSPEAQEALAMLCRVYWYPLYAYARRRLTNADDAQELTQEFFAQLLEKDYLQVADPARGKFRSFLLTAFKHFLAKQRDRANAEKRGGGRQFLSLDFQTGERRYDLEPADHARHDLRAPLGVDLARTNLGSAAAGIRERRQAEALRDFESCTDGRGHARAVCPSRRGIGHERASRQGGRSPPAAALSGADPGRDRSDGGYDRGD